MNLVIDIGNSAVKMSIFQNNREIFNDKYFSFELSHIVKIKQQFPDIKHTILSSVLKSGYEEDILKIFENTLILNETTRLPVKTEYKTPETLGKDRIAAVTGAHTLYPDRNKLVIDAGTAITYDFIDKNGIYAGGNISPGLKMRYKALHNFTNRLPLIDYSNDIDLTGKTTREAINNGVVFGMIYEIQGYISAYMEKYKDLTIIMTGGDAIYFEEKLKSSIFVIFNLNLLGLNRILEYNVAEE